jgi:transcriptional regulator with XRE-family HTH domain
MPSKPPTIFPQEQRMLGLLGERIKLARLRRKFSSTTVSARAGICRTTLYKVEVGDGGVTLGTYLRVLASLGLSEDFEKLAADDHVGRRLQDLGLEPKIPAGRRRAVPA